MPLHAVQRGYCHQREHQAGDRATLLHDWAAFDNRASELLESMAQRHLNFVRAMKVIRHIARSDQPLGQALAAVSELSRLGVESIERRPESWRSIQVMADELSDQGGRDRLIDAADRVVSTAPQLRKAIIAGARAKLHDALAEAHALLASFLRLRVDLRQSSSGSDADLSGVMYNLQHALTSMPREQSGDSVGATALARLVRWLGADPREGSHPSLNAALDAAQQALFEIPRDAAQRPLRPPTLEEIATLIDGRDPEEVVRGYLAAGNLNAARTYMAEAGIPPNTPLDDELLRGGRTADRALSVALDEVDRIAARLRALYVDEQARQLTAAADNLRSADPERHDLALVPLHELAALGSATITSFIDTLRERIANTTCSEQDRARITDLLEQGDAILAVDFLTRVESGLSLPEVTGPHGDDFSSFFPSAVDAAVEARDAGEDVFVAVQRLVGSQSVVDSRHLLDGIGAWNELKTKRRALSSQEFRGLVANVVRFIGLVPRNQSWLQEITTTQRAGYASFRVRATPFDRSYVPSLGTQAHQTYDLTLVWDAATPGRLLDFIDEKRRNHANIIVYFGVLDVRQRLALRSLTTPGRGKGASPVVVDEAVAGWLSTRPEPGWRITQRVTLPFTTLNPYTPFAGGEVPNEVFVGREMERAAIESPTGSMFVYGGRQLGKSALLRRVERMFSDEVEVPNAKEAWRPRTGRVAIYIDLKAASIGEMQQPSALWGVLAERLRTMNVLSPKTGRGMSGDSVTSQIEAWLRLDESNRLLLLLDEADNFLTADFRDAQGGRTGMFPTLQRLKSVMETSNRRFKPVFAGLHQVQRFHDTSNTPVAHGGADILIGPLRSQDAYGLVVDPMHALGYTFASPELVWRLLLFTNYQASLVQIVCEALVRHVQDRALPDGGGRVVIEDADVDAIYAKPKVRDLIAQRFRWTINLDSHYRVIALVVAINSLDAAPGEAFSVDELREQCETFWPEGFAMGVLSGKEFQRYLEEMVGLGVLHLQGDEYGLRSPTIIGLLGSRESLNQELAEASRHLELEYEYNPTMNRRIVGDSTALWAPRSPLNDRDLAVLLPQEGTGPQRVRIVTGSLALAVDRVATALEAVAAERQLTCLRAEPSEVDDAVTAARGRRHLIVDLHTADGSVVQLNTLCAKLGGRQGLSGTVIVGPALLPDVREPGVPVVTTRRWSTEGLRSWHDSPFDSPELRAGLYRLTAGWPQLVERAMR